MLNLYYDEGLMKTGGVDTGPDATQHACYVILKMLSPTHFILM